MKSALVHVPVQSVESAPDASRDLLKSAGSKFGFVPNLLGMFANAPALLEGYLTLAAIFDKASLSPVERQIVLLAASFENGCEYCMAAHTAIAGMQKVDQAVIGALRDGQPIADAKLEALRSFTAEAVRTRGWPSAETVARFTGAGYTPAQALEVILGIGVKTLSNYANHLAATPLDAAFAPVKWSKPVNTTTCCSSR